MTERPIRISIIGGSSCTAEEAETARTAGKEIARRGGVLVCGGLDGVMEAAAAGAKEAGGVTVGILRGKSADEANPFIDIPIVTDMGDGRNVIVASSCDAVVAVGGQVGTLSEIAFALNRGTPVFAVGSWNLDESRFPEGARLVHCESAEEAVELAFESAKTSNWCKR